MEAYYLITDRPDMTIAVYRGCKTTKQQRQHQHISEVMSRNRYEEKQVAENYDINRRYDHGYTSHKTICSLYQ